MTNQPVIANIRSFPEALAKLSTVEPLTSLTIGDVRYQIGEIPADALAVARAQSVKFAEKVRAGTVNQADTFGARYLAIRTLLLAANPGLDFEALLPEIRPAHISAAALEFARQVTTWHRHQLAGGAPLSTSTANDS